MPKRIGRGPLQADGLGDLIDDLDDLQERVKKLEGPSGEALAQTVARLEVLVADLQTYLDDYIANDLPALVTSSVNTAIAALLAGDVVISGNLSVGVNITVTGDASIGDELYAGGAVRFPNIPATTFVVEPRAVTWVDTSNGRLGRT